jgi:exopolysaccharide production protein ExoZ
MRAESTDVARDPAHPGAETVYNIQALRGIAASMVVWTHVRGLLGVWCPSIQHSSWIQASQGAMGVDLFFVISGFVISLTACKRHHHPIDFLLARIARISPLYLIYLVLFLLSKFIFTGRFSSFASLWNGILYLPLFDTKDFTWPPGGAGWSLSFEMWFYVAFSLLLIFQPPRKVATMLPFIFIIGAPLTVFYRGEWYFPTFIFHPLTLDFAYGCIIFQIQRLISPKVTVFLLVAGILWLWFMTRQSGDLAFPRTAAFDFVAAWRRSLFWGVPSALMVAAFVGLERNRVYVMPPALIWLGGISYSLYLSHQMTLDVSEWIGVKLGAHNWILLLLVAPVCILVGWLCWKWIERPLTILAQGWAKHLSQQAIVKNKNISGANELSRISR